MYQKQKADKEKKQGENNGKKDANPKPKSESQERRDASNERKRNLSLPKDNRSPVRGHTSCAQVRVQRMGNHPSGTHSDSDEDDYDTPPETLDSDNDLEEENDDPNVPENSDDDISEDEDNKVLHNRPENDSAISVGNLLNFPDLLRLNKSGQDTMN